MESASPHLFDAESGDGLDRNLCVRLGDVFHSQRFSGVSYAVDGKLGSGSSGIVVSARCEAASSEAGAPPAGSRVAIKVVQRRPDYTNQASLELSLLSHLGSLRVESAKSHAHPKLQCVTALIDHFVFDGHVCIVQELHPGSLLSALSSRGYSGLDLPDIATILYQLLYTIHELHAAGLMHADVKPENIMLAGPGGVEILAEETAVAGAGGSGTPSVGGDDPVSSRGSSSSSSSAHMPTLVSRHGSSASAVGEEAEPNIVFPPVEELQRIIQQSRMRARLARRTLRAPLVRLIDFGSAGFEAGGLVPQSTYAQSRFYRAPEVLLGMRHTGAIDLWGVGCLAAELWLGLPIFGGYNEHDCISRMCMLLGFPPEGMLENAPQAGRFFSRKKSSALDEAHAQTVNDSFIPDIAALKIDGRNRSASAADTITRTPLLRAGRVIAYVSPSPSINSSRECVWTPPTPPSLVSASRFRLKTPNECLRAGPPLPVPHPSARHFLPPENIFHAILAYDEGVGLSANMVGAQADRLLERVGASLRELYADAPPVRRSTQRPELKTKIPGGVSDEEVALRAAFADLVTCLLDYDPRTRLTAAEALGHQFFSIAGLGKGDSVSEERWQGVARGGPAELSRENETIRARRGDYGCGRWVHVRALAHLPLPESSNLPDAARPASLSVAGRGERRFYLSPNSPPWHPTAAPTGPGPKPL